MINYPVYSNKDIPTGFLEHVLNNGCQYLGLASAQIDGDSLKCNASQLKYLDLSLCESSRQVFDDLLSSCHSLEKLALDNQGHLHNDLVKTMCCQFGATLQVLDLSKCNVKNMEPMSLEIIQLMIDNFSQLKEVNFRDTYLSEQSLDYVSNNLSETAVKVGFSGQRNLINTHVTVLVKRCNKLTSLDLSDCDRIANISLDNIVESLKLSLEELYISGTNIDAFKILELQSMSRLKLLICIDLELEDISVLHGIIPNLKHECVGFINIATSTLPKYYYTDILTSLEKLEEGFWEIDAKQLQLFRRPTYNGNDSDSETSYDEGYRLGFAQGFNGSESEYDYDEYIDEYTHYVL